ARIEETKKRHYDARHNCWCYRIREGAVRYSDDGEPQGTAGQPMLNVFEAGEITDVACVVTRYFGGVLLGAGGLVRAYSAAAKAALDAAGRRRMARWQSLRFDCPYPLYERVKRLLDSCEAVTEGCDFGAAVSFAVLLREDRAGEFGAALTELSAGAVTAELTGESFRGVRVE
ncbi:MAG: YigZ family protein, partial [Oscillospiraceae bacterium]|nr:YigZ family protein [Oscillospiraceae bacterium]